MRWFLNHISCTEWLMWCCICRCGPSSRSDSYEYSNWQRHSEVETTSCCCHWIYAQLLLCWWNNQGTYMPVSFHRLTTDMFCRVSPVFLTVVESASFRSFSYAAIGLGCRGLPIMLWEFLFSLSILHLVTLLHSDFFVLFPCLAWDKVCQCLPVKRVFFLIAVARLLCWENLYLWNLKSKIWSSDRLLGPNVHFAQHFRKQKKNTNNKKWYHDEFWMISKSCMPWNRNRHSAGFLLLFFTICSLWNPAYQRSLLKYCLTLAISSSFFQFEGIV